MMMGDPKVFYMIDNYGTQQTILVLTIFSVKTFLFEKKGKIVGVCVCKTV